MGAAQFLGEGCLPTCVRNRREEQEVHAALSANKEFCFGGTMGACLPATLEVRVCHKDPGLLKIGTRFLGDSSHMLTLLVEGPIETLQPSTWRYHEHLRARWPLTYRFQVPRCTWRLQVECTDDDDIGFNEHCLMQMPICHEQRTRANAEADVADAEIAADAALQFNSYLQQRGYNSRVEVVVPVICEVVRTSIPEALPVQSYVTLQAYAEASVTKFVCEGVEHVVATDLPHAFFHYAACLSTCSQLICDMQGFLDSDGNLTIVDPCIMHSNMVSDALPGMRIDNKGFEVLIEKKDKQRVGMRIDPLVSQKGCLVLSIGDGLVRTWNGEHPFASILPGDEILEVNGVTDSVDMIVELQSESKLHLKCMSRSGQSESIAKPVVVDARDRFDALHPVCKPLCQSFDPTRRCALSKHLCIDVCGDPTAGSCMCGI